MTTKSLRVLFAICFSATAFAQSAAPKVGHGSNEPETIGQAVSSGCFRMTNDDVIDLYNRVSVGATVIVR
jgi:lipoprotein-anchoring transpeptidase ErfK/SrfK